MVVVGMVREVIGLLFDDFSREKVVDTEGLLVGRSETLLAAELLRVHDEMPFFLIFSTAWGQNLFILQEGEN